MATGLIIKEFDSAQEFWDTIKPENLRQLFPTQANDLVFRGQSDHTWSLQPSAYRTSKAQTIKDQIIYEIKLLTDFLAECDSTGTDTPEHSTYFRESFKTIPSNLESNPHEWPQEYLYTTIAYAQHYGLPTRLLDWSRNSFAAAYFSASGALNKMFENLSKPNWFTNKKMSVWVLDTTVLHHFKTGTEDYTYHVNLINTSSGINKNIASQKGCFTVLRRHFNHEISLSGSQPFDPNFTLVEFFEGWNECNHCEIKPLLKLTLPYTEVPELISLANAYHISESILYPGAYSAARAAIQKQNLNTVKKFITLNQSFDNI